MSTCKRFLFVMVPAVLMLGAGLICWLPASNAQSQVSPSAASGQDPKAKPNKVSGHKDVGSPARHSDTSSAERAGLDPEILLQKQQAKLEQAQEQLDKALTHYDSAFNEHFVDFFGRKKATGTVLGVHVSKASPVLRKHLKLPRQFGLLIEHIDPGTAAADAKLQRFDVLYKFDDQLLVNEEQLTALVRMRQPKDGVAVSLYRNGESMQIEVFLKSGKIVDKSDPNWKPWSIFYKTHADHSGSQTCLACHGYMKDHWEN